MIEPARRHATYDDLIDLPENLVGEILGGELHTHPRPAPRHARAYSSLGGNLFGAYDSGAQGPGGWWIPMHACSRSTGCRTMATGCCCVRTAQGVTVYGPKQRARD